MTATVVSIGLGLVIGSFGAGSVHEHRHYRPFTEKYLRRQERGQSHFLPPGPGNGVGFPNDAPDKYGWVDDETYLPIGADRTAEYYFPRYFSAPPQQLFLWSSWNPYQTMGQRYIPYCGDGGEHPMGGPPIAPADLPVSPYAAMPDSGPLVPLPRLNGRVEAPPVPSGGLGLTP